MTLRLHLTPVRRARIKNPADFHKAIQAAGEGSQWKQCQTEHSNGDLLGTSVHGRDRGITVTEVNDCFSDWIWDLLHGREFMSGTVGRPGSTGEPITTALLNGHAF